MSGHISLLIIDPQNDFCDQASAAGNPALPVSGAHDDMNRLAHFIMHNGHMLDRITVTLDSHSPVDIAHPTWWRDADGNAPTPFTVIAAEDVSAGIWRTSNPDLQEESERYIAALTASDRYSLVVWPEHCLIGSWGHGVHPAVTSALNHWSRTRGRVVNFVFKGMNPSTEHYSAIRAEVIDVRDDSTQKNTMILNDVHASKYTFVAGEALSHCVANTVRDIERYLPGAAEKMVLLTDCTSSVSGFLEVGEAFIDEMRAKGLRFATSETFIAEKGE